jgi:TM2 domain-containing membrane protein YozV
MIGGLAGTLPDWMKATLLVFALLFASLGVAKFVFALLGDAIYQTPITLITTGFLVAFSMGYVWWGFDRLMPEQ